MKKNTILVAGLPQSGSTLLYNLIRLILDKSDSKLKLVKTHGYDKKLHDQAKYIVLPMRDLRDIIASTKAKNPAFKNGDVVEIGKNHLKWHNDWRPFATHIWHYEWFKQGSLMQTKLLVKALEVKADLNLQSIIDEAENLKNSVDLPPEQTPKFTKGMTRHAAFWRKTKLSKTHITNNGKIFDSINRLKREEIKVIQENFKEFLTDNGYFIYYDYMD